jgi:hypothetical protein
MTIKRFQEIFMRHHSNSSGDMRMGIGENPKKVWNIVTANVPAFRELYLPLLSAYASHLFVSDSQDWQVLLCSVLSLSLNFSICSALLLFIPSLLSLLDI